MQLPFETNHISRDFAYASHARSVFSRQTTPVSSPTAFGQQILVEACIDGRFLPIYRCLPVERELKITAVISLELH